MSPNDTLFTNRFLQTCDIPLPSIAVEPFTLVIFGGAGDLSKRKLLPTLFHLYQEKELPNDFSVLAFARSKMADDTYRQLMKEAVREFSEEPFSESSWAEFSNHLSYLSGLFEEDTSYEELNKILEQSSVPTSRGDRQLIYYLSVPPQVTPVIVEKLKNHCLCKEPFQPKIIVEKPFGRDRPSAVKMNKVLTEAFDENQIYRIDHYLGKETVQNIIFFRFSNSIFEDLWNSRHVDHVQITVAEDLGIERRSTFYEESGVVRDIVQNHLLQLIALVAMEPPIGFEAEFIRDEKRKVFHSIQPMSDDMIDRFTVRGQYGPGKIDGQDIQGYREEEGIPADSNTPTFFAARLNVANWRWTGVPFYLRTGKRMSKRVTEIAIQFKQPPLRLFGRTCDVLEPNILVLTIQPDERISLRFGVKYPYSPNQIYTVNMTFGYQETFKTKFHHPYDRLLLDCMKGDLTLFVREDEIEAMWDVVDPIVSRWERIPPQRFPNYAAGTWGPSEAHSLLDQEGRHWITG
jgi:glucose-6-phosphate 1-dehydrogenase